MNFSGFWRKTLCDCAQMRAGKLCACRIFFVYLEMRYFAYGTPRAPFAVRISEEFPEK
jgi:hypothetical protein